MAVPARSPPSGSASDGAPSPLTVSRAAVRLAWLVAVLAAFAAGVGLLWSAGVASETATTVRGEVIELHGYGLSRYDSAHVGPVHRGTDAVALLLWLPLLLYATARYRQGSLLGALLLASALLWFLYLYLSLALGAAYNELFLVYVLLIAATGTALLLVARSVDTGLLADQLSPRFPARGIATFLAITAAATLLLWGGLAIAALIQGSPPAHMGLATTTVEEALSLGLLVPAFICAAIALRRGSTGIGTLIGFPLLVLVAGLAPTVGAQTIAQLLAGITLEPAEIAGLAASWVVLGLIALSLAVRAWRAVSEPLPRPAMTKWVTRGSQPRNPTRTTTHRGSERLELPRRSGSDVSPLPDASFVPGPPVRPRSLPVGRLQSLAAAGKIAMLVWPIDVGRLAHRRSDVCPREGCPEPGTVVPRVRTAAGTVRPGHR